jgi:hypothetical protein
MTTSKTIAALLGPTLIATAISLLANLDISQTLIEGLSQSPALIMIAGYAAFVPGLAIVYFQSDLRPAIRSHVLYKPGRNNNRRAFPRN